MYQYLKDEIYYNELYDKHTIEECRWWEKQKNAENAVSIKEKDLKKTYVEKKNLMHFTIEFSLYFIKGERYREKFETIRGWMNRDRARDEHQKNAIEPRNIHCLGCSSIMNVELKDLHTELNEKNERVLFMFRCLKCQKARAYWEDGEEWGPSPNPCPKCKIGRLESSSVSRKDYFIMTVYSCSRCGHRETETFELGKKREELIDPNFESDRKKYCLSDKEGGEYISWTANLKQLTEMIKDHEENKNVYEAIENIKKLTIVELQNLLTPLIEENGFVKLELEKLEISRDLIISFSLQDSMPNRKEYDSVHELQRLVRKALESTNWRLMSGGISYRLGFLSGRLRGIEGNEALRDLLKKENR